MRPLASAARRLAFTADIATLQVMTSPSQLARPFAATLAAASLAIAAPSSAQTSAQTSEATSAPAPFPAPSEIVAAAPASDWVAIAPADLLVMDLAPDAQGRTRRVVIQLMPAPFSQGWVANIRTLAAAHWWDGLSINRVQDNYVVQWGDADGEDPAKARTLPEGLATVAEDAYSSGLTSVSSLKINEMIVQAIAGELPNPGQLQRRGGVNDPYAGTVGFLDGWAMGTDASVIWPVHCYAMVGVGRNLSPDTGSGAELYTVIGHAPRHLDRNIALVGRVIEGIEHLSSLPRGTEALGFYATAGERTPIASVRLATELPPADQPRFEYLSTQSASFARYADARANRRDPFFNVPAGGADICNIPVPVRRKP